MPYDIIDTATAPQIAGTFGAPLTSVGKTLSKLQTDVAAKVKNRADVDPSTLTTAINDAYQEMSAELDIEELTGAQVSFTATIGQASYKLPVAVFALDVVQYVDATLSNGGYPLWKIDEQKYFRLEVAHGVPTHYFRFQNYLVLWPTPNAACKIAATFDIRPQNLVNPTDSPIFDAQWHLALVHKARAILLELLDDATGAAQAQNAYLNSIRPKINKASRETQGSYMTISSPRRRSDLFNPPPR